MRIALITETFLPNVNGIVTTLCRLLEYAQSKGHETLLFAPRNRLRSTPVHRSSHCAVVLFPSIPTSALLRHSRALSLRCDSSVPT